MNNLFIYFCSGVVIGMFLYILCLAVYDILLSNDDFKSIIKFFSKKL